MSFIHSAALIFGHVTLLTNVTILLRKQTQVLLLTMVWLIYRMLASCLIQTADVSTLCNMNVGKAAGPGAVPGWGIN